VTSGSERQTPQTDLDPFSHYQDRKTQLVLRQDARLISHSEIATFKRCRRKWWLAWYRGLRLRAESPTGPRAIGDRVHRALAQWYVPDGVKQQRRDPRDALEALITSDTQAVLIKFKNDENIAGILLKMKKDDDMERAMVSGYVQWLEETGADANYEVLASERYEDAILPGISGRAGVPVFIIAKLDAKVRRRSDGVLRYVDHKTVADFGSKTLLLAIDEQMLWYGLIEILTNTPLGERSGGAIFNMLRRVKRTANAKPPFYERAEILHNRYQLENFYHQLWGTVHDMLDLERRLDVGVPHHQAAYPTPNPNCSWDCDYRMICPLFNDGSRVEGMIENYYAAGDPLAYYYKDEVK
jgi:hypothetical protein